MPSKIQKLFTVVFVSLAFCGVFSTSVFAGTCDSKESCEAQIIGKRAAFQQADALLKNFSLCVAACGFWEVSVWNQCKINYGEESCDVVYNTATEETEESDYAKITEALARQKSQLGTELAELRLRLQAISSVNVKEVLSLEGQENPTDLKTFLDKTIDVLVKMVGLVAFIFLIIGGFRLLVAAGNDNEIQKAKTMLTYAIIGLAVALLAYIIVAAVQGVLYG